MVVQHNISAMNANRYFGINNSGLSKSLEKLSSGYAINRAGDNAAGLAVSEKMRAQISGLTQATKNAQDGISMVQTFEGALTETDSILQRMRTLAVQSANGTYQDDVDREAIQLEFDQLNDELNQIADTDFNGVVVLNGGQMADGTKAVDGTFDYSTRTPRQLVKSDINKVDSQLFDDKNGATNGVTKADDVWEEISGGTWVRNDPDKSNGPDSVDVTLQYNATNKQWSVVSASNGAQAGKLKAEDDGTKNGGFNLTTDAGIGIANVVIDESKLVDGDTITLTLNNPANATAAPKNAGSEIISNTVVEKGAATDIKVADINLTTTVEALDDSDMTDTISKIFNALDGATYTTTYTDGTRPTAGNENFSLKLSDGTLLEGKNYTTPTKASLSDGTEFWVAANANGTLEISTVNAAGDAAETKLMTIAPTPDTDDNKSAGTVSWKIGIEHEAYDSSKIPTVEVKSPTDGQVSQANSNEASTATLTYTDNITLQTGARTKDSVNFTFAYESNGLGELKADLDCSARGLGTDKLSLSTQEDANAAIDKIDNAINKVSMVRASFGAMQNRLEHKIANLEVNNENLTAAESRIRDTDMAKEMTNFTKNQILSQASQAMLAQANQLPQGVLQLLG